MSADSQPRRERAPRSKVRPITEPDALLRELPCNLDAERFILGAVLLDGSRFTEVETLTVDDFSLERHRRVFGAMHDLSESTESIDYITVADRLKQRNENGPDDLTFLTDLSTGLPVVPHLDSWVRILRKANHLRCVIRQSAKVMNECQMSSADPVEILARHAAEIEAFTTTYGSEQEIRRVEDLDSIFADRSPTEYVVKPELPAKAIVCLTGDSESGKTTLACAWARDAILQGHAVLLLDRDKNPRERVRDRLERLGIPPDCNRLWVWDCQQKSEPPQPNDPVAVAWVKRMVAATGKSPLVIGDSLVSFLMGDEDENSAKDMRAVFDRFRVLNSAGATVILIHHLNRNGEARGSSDFKPAGDQGFLVSNRDRAGGRLLDVITLKYEKSRWGLSGTLTYHYAAGKMLQVAACAAGKSVTERLVTLLRENPGVLTDEFVTLAQENRLKREAAREFLKRGESDDTIRVEVQGRSRRHFWRAAVAERGS